MITNNQISDSFHRIGNRFAHFFDQNHFLGRSPLDENWLTGPKVNTKAKSNAYVLEVELPGYSREDIEIFIEYDKLNIRTKDKSVKPNASFVRKEFHQGRMKRNFLITKEVDRDKITAKMENGLLKIILPIKTENTGASRRVDIA